MVKPGYKQTEIGVIPEDWKIQYLSDFGDVISGGTPSTTVSEYWDGDIAWCTPSDITSTMGKYIYKTDRNITHQGLKNSAATILPPNSILLCTRATIGELKLSGVPMATNQGFKNLCPNATGNVDYLYYLLQTKKKDMVELAIGSTFLEISKKALCSIALQTPSLPEQECIAEALSDVDSMISSLEKLIAKKKAVKQGAMQELLTGKKRLPGFTGEWHHEPFGKLCTICRGGSPRPIQDYLTTSDSGINWIKIGDVKPNAKYITSTQEKIVESGVSMSRRVYKGDFILSNSMSFGRPYILKLDGCIHDGWLAIQDYQVAFDTDFLYYVLGSNYVFEQYIQMAAGSSVQNLNKDKVAKLDVFVPPMEEQSAIASILSDMDNEIEALEQKLEKTRQIKQGMMQQLLTGKIRLV